MGNSISGFFAKLLSTDSIVSRIVRGIALVTSYVAGLGHGPETVNQWLAALAAFLGGFIGAGQNQSSPTTATAKKAVPPTS